MMRKQIKSKVQMSSNPACIKILMDDEYILKCVELSKFKLPHIVTELYKTDIHGKTITLIPKHDRIVPSQNHVERIKILFEGIMVHHVRGQDIMEKEDDFKRKISNINGHQILGIKKFYIDTGRFQKDDYLIYKRGDAPIKEVLKQLKNYLSQESLLIELDSLFQQRVIPALHCKSVCIALVQEVYDFIMEEVQRFNFKADKIMARFDDKTKEKRPIYSIQIVVSGSAMNVHELFLALYQKVRSVQTIVIQIDQQRIPTQNVDNLKQLFPDTKITKISPNTVLILDKYLDFNAIENVKRKLKQIVWIIDQDCLFSIEEIRTLQAEIKNNSLIRHMRQRKIQCQHIDCNKSTSIQITCDKLTRNRFVEECKNYLKSFVKVQQICVNFDNNFLIQIFKKYYQQKFEEQFTVTFEVGDGYMIRSNFNKYSQQIQQQLKVVREKIRKKTMTIISRKSLAQIAKDNLKLFNEVVNPSGYQQALLGCHVYNMGNIKIKMRPIESLKRQQQILAYIFDDGIMQSSILYKIIKDNKTNLNSFLSDAHRTKKPDRLRQYITETCPYAYRTVLLHSGPERVTNTLKRDLQTLFAILDHKSTIVILEHENDFLREVFITVLEHMKNQKPALVSAESNSSASRINKNKFEANFYFEGGQRALNQIEQVMKLARIGIQKCTQFQLEEFDFEKIYSLQYFQMKVKIGQKSFKVSPVIAQILDFQLNRELKRKNIVNNSKKKFLFSLPKPEQSNQLVQFIINTKCRTCFKITHDEGSAELFCERPHIQNLQWEQFDKIPQLQQTLATIQKYFQRCSFIVLSAECISDQLHYSRTIKLSSDYYMVKQDENELVPIVLDVKNSIIAENQRKSKGKFMNKSTAANDFFEIVGYKDEFDKIFI